MIRHMTNETNGRAPFAADAGLQGAGAALVVLAAANLVTSLPLVMWVVWSVLTAVAVWRWRA